MRVVCFSFSAASTCHVLLAGCVVAIQGAWREIDGITYLNSWRVVYHFFFAMFGFRRMIGLESFFLVNQRSTCNSSCIAGTQHSLPYISGVSLRIRSVILDKTLYKCKATGTRNHHRGHLHSKSIPLVIGFYACKSRSWTNSWAATGMAEEKRSYWSCVCTTI